jgi:hypothetical protein
MFSGTPSVLQNVERFIERGAAMIDKTGLN